MAKITMHLEFDSVAEAQQFISGTAHAMPNVVRCAASRRPRPIRALP